MSSGTQTVPRQVAAISAPHANRLLNACTSCGLVQVSRESSVSRMTPASVEATTEVSPGPAEAGQAIAAMPNALASATPTARLRRAVDFLPRGIGGYRGS